MGEEWERATKGIEHLPLERSYYWAYNSVRKVLKCKSSIDINLLHICAWNKHSINVVSQQNYKSNITFNVKCSLKTFLQKIHTETARRKMKCQNKCH